MPQCPNCSAALKDDYGMIPCPSCGMFVLIDMDGNAKVANGEVEVTSGNSIAELAPLVTDDAPAFDIIPDDSPSGVDLLDPPLLSEEPAQLEPMMETAYPESSVELGPEVNPDPYAPPDRTDDGGANEPAPDGELNMDALLGFEDPNEPGVEHAGGGPVEFGQPGDPLGINDFANSELSQAKDGFLTFKILIMGIDSKEIRESLRSALDDPRFGWNPNDLMARIVKGKLQLENVAPVKAVILVNRIKGLPVRVRWEQHAVSQMEPN